ncbi:MAG: amidohydrolase [Pelobium sp.]
MEDLIAIRRYLHQHPELSGFEMRTSDFLIKEFKQLKTTQIIEEIGGHGFIVIFDSGMEGPSLLFRSELDGLPIQESSDLEYKSIFNSKGHQCGHDGHMSILLGLGKQLAANPIKKGKVTLLFQPAEETGEGAEAVIHDPLFRDLRFDEVFALHNLPSFPFGAIIVKNDSFTAAVKSVVIELHGKTAHASEPENGINPAKAVGEILKDIEELNINEPEQANFKLATLVHVKIGEPAYGVAAGDASIHYTFRSWTNEKLAELENEIIEKATAIANNNQLRISHHFLQRFYASENNPESVDLVRKACEKSGFNLIENSTPFKWGEDFGYFTKKYKGCLFGLGAGLNQPALHHPDYDFPDQLLKKGVEIFYAIIKERLE